MDLRDAIKAALAYDPETGILIWRTKPSRPIKAGSVAGRKEPQGYIRISFRDKYYMGHRIAWLLMTGDWPALHVDHINLNKADNRWANLRQATPSENNANSRGRGSFQKGVTLHKTGRYQAQIKVRGKNHYLGLFDSAVAAAAAYSDAAREHFGEFARTA